MLTARQRLGKYRIEKRISDGGFATVYQAMDTIEGIRVALKIPHAKNVTQEVLNDFRHEVRLAVQLEHPHILALKNASFIDGQFVIAFPLGERTLSDRLTSRVSLNTALDYAQQMMEAVAFAHRHRIIHCDIKPENLIIFSGNRLKLTDFGIAKVAQRTVRGSGTGTIGYMAPEQAMGKPSLRSDVFSLGLILYRMLSGKWPEWPFDWPPANFQRVRGRVHPDLITVIRRAIDPQPRKRYRDAEHLLRAFLPAKAKALSHAARKRRNGLATR
ncbi:MAG: serine/threonine-protein kinase [Planctomycetaceae bacterium]